VENLILQLMRKSDADLLRPHLRTVEMKSQQLLFEAGDQVHHVYFPYTSIISLVVILSTGSAIEAAMVGRDGVVAAASALNGKIALSRGIVQNAGLGAVCDADIFKKIAMESPLMLSIIVRHEQAVFAQAQQSAACNAAHSLEARLARWLLRARDLTGGKELHFTQEFLAEMLGVQRSSVSIVAHTLQQAGLIKYKRGRIEILDLEGLFEAACECYKSVKLNYETMLGKLNKPSRGSAPLHPRKGSSKKS
jgi:CRP-like cAMP-binding protein